ncbi:beta-N-acetylhexosaminidase [Amycolatopsis sp.]|uniref:beta-N-acetylhexosaminidase n=1 Tax=Amycolatopsis sp. TaxID=37632 RepID=UPI0026161527|nr:beta-N-acetylhexosaminidase [Amycolatopsis sp.]
MALGLPAVATSASAAPAAAHPVSERTVADVIPAPVQAKANPKADFTLSPLTVIRTDFGASPDTKQVANYLAGLLRPSTGYPLPVIAAPNFGWPAISLVLGHADPSAGTEGYQLDVAKSGVTLRANTATGLFEGVQSLRQLLPSQVEAKTVQHTKWTVSGGAILDYPRFGTRSAMLDVARHFFNPTQVETYIDQLSQYKINTLHLHLADDQGWRIEIKSWPNLTKIGGSTEVGGGAGGFYTQAQYTDIVKYAAARHITIVPEIDMPGHTNAAQASYPELNCTGIAPPLYTGTDVGFSSYCVSSPTTYKFLDDVIREISAITPGKYFGVGGDEAHSTSAADYATFYSHVLPIVAKYGKAAVGWHEIATVTPPVSAVPEYWDTSGTNADVVAAAARGNKILMAPANKAYLDQKYNVDSPLGLDWAGLVEVKDAYDWDPATTVKGVDKDSEIAGVEAALWSETISTSDNIEYLAFPRLLGDAEIAWSPKSTHNWDNYSQRLAKQGPRMTAEGIDFYRSPQVNWQ